jgi:hypothetical protein
MKAVITRKAIVHIFVDREYIETAIKRRLTIDNDLIIHNKCPIKFVTGPRDRLSGADIEYVEGSDKDYVEQDKE